MTYVIAIKTRAGGADETINRWESGRMQPSSLALRLIRMLIGELSNSPSETVQHSSKQLLHRYFWEEGQPF